MSDSTFVTHVLDLLQAVGPARARPMMGGYTVFCHELPVGLISDDRLFLKVSADTKDAFASAGCEPFCYERKGKLVEMSFWSAPDDALDAPEAMRPWAELALQAAAKGKRARKPSGSHPPPSTRRREGCFEPTAPKVSRTRR